MNLIDVSMDFNVM